MLTIYVDADACPVKAEVYSVARRYGMHVAVVANATLRMPANSLIELVVRPGFGADRLSPMACAPSAWKWIPASVVGGRGFPSAPACRAPKPEG